jgi:alkylation response protein AidB-like acyl-CoA dehydrogenase
VLARDDARVATGEDVDDLPLADRAEIHQQVAWAAETFVAAVNELFRLAGASGIYDGHVVRRCWRDANVPTLPRFTRRPRDRRQDRTRHPVVAPLV